MIIRDYRGVLVTGAIPMNVGYPICCFITGAIPMIISYCIGYWISGEIPTNICYSTGCLITGETPLTLYQNFCCLRTGAVPMIKTRLSYYYSPQTKTMARTHPTCQNERIHKKNKIHKTYGLSHSTGLAVCAEELAIAKCCKGPRPLSGIVRQS